MSLIFQKIQIPASQRNYSWSCVHLEPQPLRHSGLLLRSAVLAKIFISLSDYYSEAAKRACPTIWNSMDPCWLESLAGRWKQPSFAINTFSSLQTFCERSVKEMFGCLLKHTLLQDGLATQAMNTAHPRILIGCDVTFQSSVTHSLHEQC